MSPTLQWFHDTALGEFVRGTPWMFGAFETLHFVGLCLLMGAILIVDLRLLGLFRQMPIGKALAFTHLAAAGLAINAFTGAGFFTSEPDKYWTNPAFRLKMALLVLALANVLWFEFSTRRKLAGLPDGVDTDMRTKLIGALSLALWFTILLLGRMMPIWEPVF